VITFDSRFLLELVLYTGWQFHKFVPKLHVLLWHHRWVSDQSISHSSKMKTTSEWWKSGNERRRRTSCRRGELEAAAYVMLSVGIRGSAVHHVTGGNERQQHTSCCQWEWEAAPYVTPPGRTRDGSICHVIDRDERQHRLSCHRCMELVLLITVLGILYTEWRGPAPKCYKIVYTFPLIIFCFFDHLHCSKILTFLLLNQRYKNWGK
jgi:hypothetical protein